MDSNMDLQTSQEMESASSSDGTKDFNTSDQHDRNRDNSYSQEELLLQGGVISSGDYGCSSEEQAFENQVDEIHRDPLYAFQTYVSSGNLQERQAAVHSILKTVQSVLECNASAVETIFLMVHERLIADREPIIRSELLEQIPTICELCLQKSALFAFVERFIVQWIVILLTDSNEQVRKSCHAAVLILVENGRLNLELLERYVVPLLIQLTLQTYSDEIRIENTALLCKLVPSLGRERTVKLFLSKYTELCRDSAFRIRRLCAQSIGEMSKVLCQELTERVLVPHLVNLSQDSVWAVRKACAENFADVSYSCSMRTRRHHLAPVFIFLLADSAKWVQYAAFQQLGPFISTFADSNRTGLKTVGGELMFVETNPAESSIYDGELGDETSKELSNATSDLCSEDVVGIMRTLTSASQEPNNNASGGSSAHCMALLESTSDDSFMEIGDLFSMGSQSMTFVNSNYSSEADSKSACTTTVVTQPETASAKYDLPGIDQQSVQVLSTVLDHIRKTSSVDSSDASDSDATSSQLASIESIEQELDRLSLALSDTVTPSNGDSTVTSTITERLTTPTQIGEDAQFSSFNYWQPSLAVVNLPEPLQSSPVEELPEYISFMERRFSYAESAQERHDADAITPTSESSAVLTSSESELLLQSVVIDVETGHEEEAEGNHCGSNNVHETSHYEEEGNRSPDCDELMDYASGANAECSPPSTTTATTAAAYKSASTKIQREASVFIDFGAEQLCEEADSNLVTLDVTRAVAMASKNVAWAAADCSPKQDAIRDHKPDENLNTSSFPCQDVIPQQLLDSFVSMINLDRTQNSENEISQHCAYNLPAVAFTVGRQNWPFLQNVYRVLANDMQWKVRRTLAFSTHKLATILGPEITQADILPVFTGLMKDVDEVRIGILRNLYEFVKQLNLEHRRSIVASFADFLQTDNIRNWRFRTLLAEQLNLMCELYEIEDVNEYFSPIAMTLAIDKVAAVRAESYALIANIVAHFYRTEAAIAQETKLTDQFLADLIKSFALSQKWVRRQTFVYICEQIISRNSISELKLRALLIPTIEKLARDKIPNVRIAVAKIFVNTVLRSIDELETRTVEMIDNIAKPMLSDIDRDVSCLTTLYCTRIDIMKSPSQYSTSSEKIIS